MGVGCLEDIDSLGLPSPVSACSGGWHAVRLWTSLQRSSVSMTLMRKEGWGTWVRVQMFLKVCACCVTPWIFTLNISFGKGYYKTAFTKQSLLKSYVAHESLGSLRRAPQGLFYSFHCVKWYFFLNGIVCILWCKWGESFFVSKSRREFCVGLTILLLCDTCLCAIFYLYKSYQQSCTGQVQGLACKNLFHPPNSFMKCRY